MRTSDYDEILKGMEEMIKRFKNNPELAKEFLAKTGIYNPDGTLHENFGGVKR